MFFENLLKALDILKVLLLLLFYSAQPLRNKFHNC